MAAHGAAAALDARPAGPLARGALLSVPLAALRAGPRVGAAAPCAARFRRPSVGARRPRLGPPAGEGDHRLAPSRARRRASPRRATAPRGRLGQKKRARRPVSWISGQAAYLSFGLLLEPALA